MRFGPTALTKKAKQADRVTGTHVLLLSLTALAIAWLAVIAVVVGMCAESARGDRALQGRLDAQTFRLRSTWRPVRTRIFRSSQSDQPAT